MKMPSTGKAYVPVPKLRNYLLSAENSDGKHRVFNAMGYTLTNWDQLGLALINIAQTYDVTEKIETRYGVKYVIDGQLLSLREDTSHSEPIRTVWIIEEGETEPRFVTAYPNW